LPRCSFDFHYITLTPADSQWIPHCCAKLLDVEFETLGRKLGIGARLANKLLKEQAKRQASQRAVAHPLSAAAANTAVRAHSLRKGLSRGGQGFWSNAVGPFARAGKALWLEVTGLFFGLFALFFAQNIYRLRSDYARGPEHDHFVVYCLLFALFAYFSISSFLRARRVPTRRKR
jgi:hypothetical protein